MQPLIIENPRQSNLEESYRTLNEVV